MQLNLPVYDDKPRGRYLTCLIDPGVGLHTLEDMVNLAGKYIDFVKFGWGSGFITECLDKKIEILKNRDIKFWFGGTLFEICVSQNKLDDMVDWLKDKNVSHIELSDGNIELSHTKKLKLIEKLSNQFTVLSEVGSKDAAFVSSPSHWVEEIKSELEAGAWKIIAEGRETGLAGIYRSTGEIRMGLIQDIAECGINLQDIIFEAPQKSQQVWFINNVGRDVNLGNIAIADALNVACLRLSLRSDTIRVNDANLSTKILD